MAVTAAEWVVPDEGSEAEEHPVPLSADHWQQVDQALDVLVGSMRAGHVKEANMLAMELRSHLMSLQRNDQLWQGQIEAAERIADACRKEFRHATVKSDEVQQELQGMIAERSRAEAELRSISQQMHASQDGVAGLQKQLGQLCAEQECLEAQRLMREEMRRQAAEEEQRQLEAEQQRLQELQRREAEEKRRREELERQELDRQQREEALRRQEAEIERRSAELRRREEELQLQQQEAGRQQVSGRKAQDQDLPQDQRVAACKDERKQGQPGDMQEPLQEEELQEQEVEMQQGDDLCQQQVVQSGGQEQLSSQHLGQTAEELGASSENQTAACLHDSTDKVLEEVHQIHAVDTGKHEPQQGSEAVRGTDQGEECQQPERENGRQAADVVDNQHEVADRCEETKSQQPEVPFSDAKLNYEELRQQYILQNMTWQQEPAAPAAGESIELPRLALHGFDPSAPLKAVAHPQKLTPELCAGLGAVVSPPDAKPQDECSEVTDIDAATEPLHSEESQPEQLSTAEHQLAPPEPQPNLPPQVVPPAQLSPEQRERQCGELFLELGRRLGHGDQNAQERRPAVEAPVPPAPSASASLLAAEAALRAAAAQRTASVQQLMGGGATTARSVCAPIPRPHDSEAAVIARSLSPVRIVSAARPASRALPAKGVLGAPWFESQKVPPRVCLESAQAVAGALRPVPATMTARGVPTVQKEGTEPTRGLSPVPARFRSLATPAAHQTAQGADYCAQAGMCGDRSHQCQPTTPCIASRDLPSSGLARFTQADHPVPVLVRPGGSAALKQQVLNNSGSLHAPASQQAELLAQMPGSPLYAPRQMQPSLCGSFVAPAGYLTQIAARPAPEPQRPSTPLKPQREAHPQRAASPIRPVRWLQAADHRTCDLQPVGRGSLPQHETTPMQIPQRAASPLRPVRWLHTADPSWNCEGHAANANGDRPEETRYVGVARLADHVRRFPQTVQTISGGSVRNVTMEPVDVPKKSSTKTAL